jgi:phosphoglycolate phosphatase-like HAD superfamily hydrolase
VAHACHQVLDPRSASGAVATGKDSATDLGAAGADTVLSDLTDTPAVVAAIYGQIG